MHRSVVSAIHLYSLLKKDRSIVSDIPGTTRDSLNERVVFDNKIYNVIDTAGVPRKKQRDRLFSEGHSVEDF